MKKKNSARFILLALLYLYLSVNGFGQNNPAVASCNGQQFICADGNQLGACVNIVLDSAYAYFDSIDYFLLSWGDQTSPDTLPFAGNLSALLHTYNLDAFYNSCQYQTIFPVILETIHVGSEIDPTNSAFFFTVRNPPSGNLLYAPSNPCVGDTVNFFGASSDSIAGNYPNCPSTGSNYAAWDFGDGQAGASLITYHIYDTSGQFSVQFCNGNVCDTLCTNLIVPVTGWPEVVLEIDSGILLTNGDTINRCLYAGEEFLVLSAVNSKFADTFTWNVDGPASAFWLPGGQNPPDSSRVTLRVNEPGTYQISVVVDNYCMKPDSVSFVLQMLEEPVFLLNEQADTCFPFQYEPAPFFFEAVYYLNGDTLDTLPAFLDYNGSPYIVEATLSDFCGFYQLSDTFSIAPPTPIEILSPPNGAFLCPGEPALLWANFPVVTWFSGDSLLGTFSDTVFFYPTEIGQLQLSAEFGAGACRTKDSLELEVIEQLFLELDPVGLICQETLYTPAPFDDRFSYLVNGIQIDSFPIFLDTTDSPYQITALFSNQCDADTLSMEIVIEESPVVTILKPVEPLWCADSMPVPLIASIVGGTWSGGSLNLQGSVPYFLPATPGFFRIFYETGSGSCLAIDSVDITVLPADTVDAGPDPGFCFENSTAILSGGVPAGGMYSGFSLTGNQVNLFNLEVDSIYPYIYTLPFFPESCNTDTVFLARSKPVFSNLALKRDSFCLGDTVTLITDLEESLSWVVDWGDGTVDSDLFNHVYDASGNYMINLLASASHPASGLDYCLKDTSLLIHIGAPPSSGILDFSLSDTLGCNNLMVSFSNQSQLAEGTFSWNFGNGTTFVGPDPPPVFFQGLSSQDTVYTVRLTAPGKCGLAKAEKSIRLIAEPQASFGIDNLKPCSGEPVKTTVTTIGSPSESYFFASDGQWVVAPPNTPVYLTFSAQDLIDTVQLFLVSSNYCGSDTSEKQLVVYPANTLAAYQVATPVPHCVGSPVILVNQSTAGAKATWTYKNGESLSADTLEVTYFSPGFYPVSLLAEGCTVDSVETALLIEPLPLLNLVTDPVSCPDVPVPFSVNTNADQIVLDYGDGAFTTSTFSTHLFSEPGNFAPQVTAISAAGCQTTVVGSIQVVQNPEAFISVQGSPCEGAELTFSASGDPVDASCFWQFGDGFISGNCEIEHFYGESATYPVVLTRTNDLGCAGRDTLLLNILDGPTVKPEWELSDPCAPTTAHFSNDQAGIASHYWNLGDGTIDTLPAFFHLYENPGSYTITYVAEALNGCVDSFFTSIGVLPPLDFNLNLDTYCTNDEGVDLTISTAPENAVFVSLDGQPSQGLFFPGLSAGRAYDITLLNPNGCRVDTTLIAWAVEELQVLALPDSVVLELGESIQLKALVNRPNVVASWLPQSWLSNAEVLTPTATPLQSIEYSVQVVDDRGCAAVDSIWIKVRADRKNSLFLPNAFTPNGDGVNDFFYPRANNKAVREIADFRVVDKNNSEVFNVRQIEKEGPMVPDEKNWGWDGMFRGQKAEAGAYRYLVEAVFLDGRTQVFSGAVLLIR